MKWKVEGASGVKVVVDADDAFDACVAAIKSKKFKSLGVLMQAWPKDEVATDDNTFIVSSEEACKEAGMWGGIHDSL